MKLLRNEWTCCLAAALTFAACGPEVLGSRYVKSQLVRAGESALVTVDASESPELDGTRLEIPAGALSGETTVTVELGLTSLLGAELSAGPAAVFGPAGTTFNTDVTLVLPVKGLLTSDDIGIVGIAADGRAFEVDASQVALDASRTRASFRIRQLAKYQPRRRPACSANAACQQGLVCVNGRCRAPPPSDTNDAGASSCPMSCPTGSACSPNSMVCVVQPTQCNQTQDCPTNFACVNGTCQSPSTSACGMNAACPQGQACQNGQCAAVPTDGGSSNPGACMSNADCGANAVCVNGACRTQCVSSVEICNQVDDDCDGIVDEGCNGNVDGGQAICGGILGLQCVRGFTCVYDPNTCPPNTSDCQGVCVEATDGGHDTDGGPATCGGIAGLQCAQGFSCFYDPNTCPPNTSDCQGVCVQPTDGGTNDVDGGMPLTCRTSQDCGTNQQCVNGVCR